LDRSGGDTDRLAAELELFAGAMQSRGGNHDFSGEYSPPAGGGEEAQGSDGAPRARDGDGDRRARGALVGQPTGGNQGGINGGGFFFLRLPRSGIELDLPLIGQLPDGDRPDAGLQPDIFVIPTVSDIARGRDAELDAVWTQARRHARRKQGE